MIRGRRTLTNARIGARRYGEDTTTSQSRLYYYRPLGDGDVLGYEFLYEPDQVMVHPALDRLAFLLEPDGVRLHWMTFGQQDASGLQADNAVDEPENRRGPAMLPLKQGEWNAIKLEMKGDRVTLSLNGVAIHQRELEPANSRQFGLFHDKERTSVQVRNVELRGRWPEALPAADRADLAALRPTEPNGEADRRARHAMIGEAFFSLQADEVLTRARDLKPEDRYRLLSEWVLPSPDHPGFRLRGDFSPSDPAPPLLSEAGARRDPDRSKPAARIESGGEVRAPAIELVATAAALGRPRLDELAERVGNAAVADDVDRRGQLALLALIAMDRGDDDTAAASLERLKPLLEKRPADQPEWESWPELTVTSRAIERQRLRPSALAVLETMVDQVQKKSPRWLWEHHVKNMRARARLLDQLGPGGPPFGSDPGVGHWARVTHGRADTRGVGEPIPQWTYRDGQFTHHPGHASDMMYLRMPLRGDFQVDCELTTFNWREMRIGYGGMIIGPMWDLKNLQRWHFNREWPKIMLNPPLEPLGDWFRYRLVVKNRSMTAFVNGRQVHQAPLTPDCDPWLALQCSVPCTGGARNMAISGRPIIPEQLNLSATPELTGWLPDYYGDSVTGDNPDWDKRGEEIVGRLRDDSPGSKQESVLLYHRPMLEDGEIAYEFFHEPGKAMAHPALDRLAFLLEPDGVKVHRLTDAQHERTGLAPDNAAVEPENRRGPASLPLKAGEWNRLQVTLSGDRVALRLNGQLIYDRKLETTNQRLFGLFHYADETEVRVRKVTYRGEWPRTLPDQLLSPNR